MSTIGFDTSNYTTSTAWTDGKTDINVRQILYVKDGERGIRQSDGVFQHMKLMPVMYEKLSEQIDFKEVKAVGVSTRPRCVEGSYMPVFLAGEGYAKVVADTLGVPLYEFSHQDGHIMAGIYSSGSFELLENDFISVHLSGGTTEILKSRYNGFNFDNEIIGGSKREERLERLIARMEELNLPEEDYWWYLDLRRYGTAVHSGFGLGFERLIMYLTGISNIRDVLPFPRTTGTAEF